jgi:hypothetical protein
MISKAKPERAASPMNGHGRACPGHPAYRGTAVPRDRGRRDKPGDDGVKCVDAGELHYVAEQFVRKNSMSLSGQV